MIRTPTPTRRMSTSIIIAATIAITCATNGCSSAITTATPDWESEQQGIIHTIERQISLLDSLKRDIMAFGHDESNIQAADSATAWLQSLLDIATDEDLQLLLMPPTEDRSFADRTKDVSVSQVHRLYCKLAYPSACEAANFIYIGAMARPEVVSFMKDFLNLDAPDSIRSEQPDKTR
jgi:hypothetical protein